MNIILLLLIVFILGFFMVCGGVAMFDRWNQFSRELFRRMDFLYSEMYQIRRKIEKLETREAEKPSKVAALSEKHVEAEEVSTPPTPEPEPAPLVVEETPVVAPAPEPTPVIVETPQPIIVAETPQPVEVPAGRPDIENRAQVLFQRGWNWFWLGKEKLEEGDDLESIAAASWLTRLGMVILVLGLGFFIKFSIDRGLLPPTVRLLGTTAAGLAMYFGGLYFWKGRLNLLGQALVAGGASVLYFSCWAAGDLYGLLSLDTAAGGACVITGLLVFSAWRRNSSLLATLGMLGAYGTPLMFKISQSPYPLLGYLSILALGLAVLRRRQHWMIPVWIALVGTIVFHSGLWSRFHSPEFAAPMLAFTCLLWAAFHMVAQRHFHRRPQDATFWELVLVGVSTLYFSLISTGIIHATRGLEWHEWPLSDILHGLAFGLGALFFFALAWWLDAKRESNRVFRSVDMGLGFLSLGVMFCMVYSRWWLPLWMMEAVAMLWVVQKAGSRALATLAQCVTLFLLIFLCLGVMVSAYELRVEQFFSTRYCPETWMDITQRLTRFLLPVACGYGVTWLTWHGRTEKNLSDAKLLTVVLGSLATVGLLEFLTAETSLWFARHCTPMRLGAISVLWTVFALGLVGLGMRYGTRSLRGVGLVFLAVVIGKIFFVDMSELEQGYRIVAMVVLGVLILLGGVLYLARKREG